MRYWKFLSMNNSSSYGGHKWKIGKWYEKKGKPVMCKNGFHCSDNIADALYWARDSDFLAEAKIDGNIIEDDGFNKICCSKMKLINIWETNVGIQLEMAKSFCSHAIENYKKYGLQSQLERMQGYMADNQYRGFFIGGHLGSGADVIECSSGTPDSHSVLAPPGYMYIRIDDKKLHHQFLSDCKEAIHNKLLEVLKI